MQSINSLVMVMQRINFGDVDALFMLIELNSNVSSYGLRVA